MHFGRTRNQGLRERSTENSNWPLVSRDVSQEQLIADLAGNGVEGGGTHYDDRHSHRFHRELDKCSRLQADEG